MSEWAKLVAERLSAARLDHFGLLLEPMNITIANRVKVRLLRDG
jgi:hypothetical protein